MIYKINLNREVGLEYQFEQVNQILPTADKYGTRVVNIFFFIFFNILALKDIPHSDNFMHQHCDALHKTSFNGIL